MENKFEVDPNEINFCLVPPVGGAGGSGMAVDVISYCVDVCFSSRSSKRVSDILFSPLFLLNQ